MLYCHVFSASKGGNINKNYDEEEQDNDIIMITDVKNPINDKKFSSNGEIFLKLLMFKCSKYLIYTGI